MGRAAPHGFDYWGPGGWFEGTLVETGLVDAGDPRPEAISVSKLPRPIPEEIIPHALVTPRGAFLWAPIEDEKHDAWVARVNRLLDKHRGGHTLVLFDAHC